MQSLYRTHKSANTFYLDWNKLNIIKHKHHLFNVTTYAAFKTDFFHIHVINLYK